MPYAAVILAGGASSRFGGTDKTRAILRGRTLLDHVRVAVADAAAIVVVGPEIQGGPVAALAAGVSGVDQPEIAILAADKLHELAGTRSVLGADNLDRYWRNARTHTLHDPVRWKYFHVGNHALNGTAPPRHAWS